MIAKLIVWDKDRDSALRQMKSALLDYQIMGLNTNLEFLSALFSVPAFAEADLDTGFIEENEAHLFPAKESVPRDVLALVCLYELLQEKAEAESTQSESNDPFSPWGKSNGWLLNQDNFHALELSSGEDTVHVIAHYRSEGFALEFNQDKCLISGVMVGENELSANLDGRRLKAAFTRAGQDITILFEGKVWTFTLHDPHLDAMDNEGDDNGLVAPMPSTVVAVEVVAGDEFKKGDALIIVEAMKMEHTILAHADGKVNEVFFQVGDQVEEGNELLSVEY